MLALGLASACGRTWHGAGDTVPGGRSLAVPSEHVGTTDGAADGTEPASAAGSSSGQGAGGADGAKAPSGGAAGVSQAGESTSGGGAGGDATAGEGAGGAPTESPPQVVQIAGGAFYTCAVRSDGKLKCWGSNNFGQLGLGDLQLRGGYPGQMGEALPDVDLGSQRRVLRVAAGNYHACALLEGGAVKCWGANEDGRLGVGDSTPRGGHAGEMGDALPEVALGTGRKAIDLVAGAVHTCALLDDHSVKCWGGNSVGQLGIGDKLDRGAALGQMGDALPAVDFGTPQLPVMLSAGDVHTCALFDDGSVRCFGANSNGQLGLGDTDARGDDANEALPAIDVGSGRHVVRLAAGRYHNCVVLDDNGVRCFGHNNVGQLGLGDELDRGDEPGEMGDALPIVDLGRSQAIVALYSAHATCAVFDDGLMKCFGYNFDAELGLGDIENRGDQPGEMGTALPLTSVGTGRTVRKVSLGVAHTCVLLDDQSVKCWGYNGNGELGLGDLSDRFGGDGDALVPTEIW